MPAVNVQNNGHILIKASFGNARWSELVRGDDVGNADMIDFSKIQQLYFTLLTLLIFGLAVAGAFTFSTTKHVAITQLASGCRVSRPASSEWRRLPRVQGHVTQQGCVGMAVTIMRRA